jgi:hypothetical protein
MQDEDDGYDFGDISVAQKASVDLSEIDKYLQLPVEDVKHPLQWWHDHRTTYPNLSRMALDYLSIPGKLPHRHGILRAWN